MSVAGQEPCIFQVAVCARDICGIATAAAPATPAPTRNLRRFVIVFDLSDFIGSSSRSAERWQNDGRLSVRLACRKPALFVVWPDCWYSTSLVQGLAPSTLGLGVPAPGQIIQGSADLRIAAWKR